MTANVKLKPTLYMMEPHLYFRLMLNLMTWSQIYKKGELALMNCLVSKMLESIKGLPSRLYQQKRQQHL